MEENKLMTRFTLAVYFKVGGFAAFLSHQETLRMFRRALVRAGIELRYSEGFNPHPKLSLLIPRSVGMASDCELLLIGILCGQQSQSADHFAQMLSRELPADISVVKVEIHSDNVKFIPESVKYLIPVSLDNVSRYENVKKVIGEFNSGKALQVERTSHKTGKTKQVNLSDFVKSVDVCADGIELTTMLVDGTSIRLDEMPSVFGLCDDELLGPVVRRAVEWEIK